jgi:predicted dehydrogenase
MRIGILGLGRAGAVHLDAWALVSDARVVAVCDPSPEVRQRARADGIAAYATPAAMLNSARLDAVTISTPPAAHTPLAIECLENGIHVLCEKPLALTTGDALRMLKVADRRRRTLLLATKFRHVAGLLAARELLAAGTLGEPIAFEVSFCSPVDMTGRWNSELAHAGGGVLIDNGCHAFDIVSFLFGSVTRVHATTLKRVQPLAVEDSVSVQVRAADGIVGRVDLSWSLATGRDSYVTVYGSRGMLEVGWRSTRIKLGGDDWHVLCGAYDKLDAHRRMLAAFVDLVESDGTAVPWISTVECLRGVAAVEAAYRSIDSMRWEWVHPRETRSQHAVTLEPLPAELRRASDGGEPGA